MMHSCAHLEEAAMSISATRETHDLGNPSSVTGETQPLGALRAWKLGQLVWLDVLTTSVGVCPVYLIVVAP